MKLNTRQLKTLIKEHAVQAVKECGMVDEPQVKMVGLGEPKMHSDLFPSIGHHNDDHDQGEKSMIKTNLARIADKASELSRLAGEMPDNEEWVQEKIAVAASMIDAVHGYLKYTDEK